MRTFTVRDLCYAHLPIRRLANVDKPYAEEARRRYGAFSEAFGCDLGSAPRGELHVPSWADPWFESRWTARALHDLLHDTLARLERAGSPFDGMLEAPEAVSVMYKRHGADLRSRAGALREAYFSLAEDLVEVLYGVPSDRTVSTDDLRAAGYDPPPPRDIDEL